MSRKRTHRKVWPLNRNTMQTAVLAASRFSPTELADLMAPLHSLLRLFREGVASEDHFHALRTALAISLAIEGSGIVKGLAGHFLAAIAALDAVALRARAAGGWQCQALLFDEIDALADAVWLHEEQLRAVSAGELHRITQGVINRAMASGGTVEHLSADDLTRSIVNDLERGVAAAVAC